jgi:DNA-binding transcriptional ArsR family regulator
VKLIEKPYVIISYSVKINAKQMVEKEMSGNFYSKKGRESILIKMVGDSPKLRIVDFFLDNPLFDFTKKEVIDALGMSKQTFYKYFPELEEYGIVKVSRKIGKAKLYRINVEHPLVKMLRDYETKMSKEMAEKAITSSLCL